LPNGFNLSHLTGLKNLKKLFFDTENVGGWQTSDFASQYLTSLTLLEIINFKKRERKFDENIEG